MTNELEANPLNKLIDEYRAIKAPPALLHRSLDCIETRDTSMGWWLPTSGALASLALLIIMAFYLDTSSEQMNQPTIAAKSLPNMSSLSNLSIEKPGNVSLSQLHIRSVSVPAMPSAPATRPTPKTRFESNQEVRIQKLQEKDNVYS